MHRIVTRMFQLVVPFAAVLLAVGYAAPLRAQTTANLVADINPGSASALNSSTYFAVSNGVLYFAATDGVAGMELWRYNGAASLAFDINQGSGGSAPQNLIDVAGSVYFSAAEPDHGRELWRFDEGTGVASRITDINPGVGSSNPGKAIVFAGKIYFAASDGAETQLYRTDGSSVEKMRDIYPSANLGNPSEFSVINNVLFFQACNASKGCELWRYNGLSAPAMNDIAPGVYSSYPHQMTGLGSKVIFGASDRNGATELYEYENESAFLLKNISQSIDGSNPAGFTEFNGRLYFSAADTAINSDPAHGYELWVTDGTYVGTHLAWDIYQGPNDSAPWYFTVFANALYFRAADFASGMELRRFDGQDGTLVGDIRLGRRASDPGPLTPLGNLLFFYATGDNGGIEPWATDGGTPFLLRDINPGGDSEPDSFTVYNGAIYFTAFEPTHGVELWSTSPCVPSAEVCNGIDDDCNGLVDDGAVQLTWYRDADRDGYGLATSTLQACSMPIGWVSDATDCNDVNAYINPGATEVCNTIDDNCNGQIDEGVLPTYYDDNDGDGFGEPNPFQSCDQPPLWWVTNGADCDDTKFAIHPGAPQICDGLNNDCNDPSWPSLVGTNEYDDDVDGYSECTGDCNDGNAQVWSLPGEANSLAFTDKTTLVWEPPNWWQVGGVVVVYDTVRSSVAADFAAAQCVETRDGNDLTASDAIDPPADGAFYYLIRPGNGCGSGSSGTDSAGAPRVVGACP